MLLYFHAVSKREKEKKHKIPTLDYGNDIRHKPIQNTHNNKIIIGVSEITNNNLLILYNTYLSKYFCK
jgi:hypothetical protein